MAIHKLRVGVVSVRQAAQRLLGSGATQLNERACRSWLAEYVPFGPSEDVADVEAAVVAAAELGYPVVCKVLSPEVVHKSDAGLVRIGLTTETELCAAVAELLSTARGLGLPDVRLSVQHQLTGVEVAVGIYRDSLGPVVVVAAGGTLVELLADAAHEMAPVSVDQARAMIDGLKVSALLHGYRGSRKYDVDALVELVVAVGELAVAVPEIAELDLNPVFVMPDGVAVADARCTIRLSSEAAPEELYGGLIELVSARRIALIGGSSGRLKVGGLLARYLRKHGFDGDLIVVNPGLAPVDGTRVVASLADVAEPIDLACIAVPQDAVAQAVRDCVAAAIPHGIVFSAGFAESGVDGRAAQDELVRVAEGRFRFLGPNSMGVAALHRDFLATFGMALEADSFERGSVAFISQSGSIASALFSRAEPLGVAFSHWIGVGNEADLGVEDFVGYVAEDPDCEVICLFVEMIRRPAAFAAAVRKAIAAGKPVVAYKTGRTEAGRITTASHTGALSSPDVVYSAFLRRHGVVRVDQLSDLFTVAVALRAVGPITGGRIGVVSMSGGACSILVDDCESLGLVVPEFDTGLRARLDAFLPSFASSRNPVDVTATGIQQPELVTNAMRTVIESGAVDLVLLQLGTNSDPSAARMARDLVDMRASSRVPFLVGRLGSPELAPQAMQIYRSAGVPVFGWPGQLSRAAAACVEFGRAKAAAATHDVDTAKDAGRAAPVQREGSSPTS